MQVMRKSGKHPRGCRCGSWWCERGRVTGEAKGVQQALSASARQKAWVGSGQLKLGWTMLKGSLNVNALGGGSSSS